jgi:hypothetical protein
LLLSIINSVHCSTIYSLYCSISFFIDSFAFSVVHCSKEKSAILILNCVQVFQSHYLFNIIIRVNKHHTADSTDFVLVWERRTYYHHGHCGIDGTNILHIDIAAEGETGGRHLLGFQWRGSLPSHRRWGVLQGGSERMSLQREVPIQFNRWNRGQLGRHVQLISVQKND